MQCDQWNEGLTHTIRSFYEMKEKNNNNNTEVLIKREPLVLPELGALYKKKKKGERKRG